MQKNRENNRSNEIITGIFSMVAGILLIISLVSRIEFISLFSGLTEDLQYVSENLNVLQINSIFWEITAFSFLILASTILITNYYFRSSLVAMQSFFLVSAAIMLISAGQKGLNICKIMNSYPELKFNSADSVKVEVLSLSGEQKLLLLNAYLLTGLNFFVFGLFSILKKKLTVFLAIFCILSATVLSVSTFITQKSIFMNIGLVMICLSFILTGFRISFSGFNSGKHRLDSISSEDSR